MQERIKQIREVLENEIVMAREFESEEIVMKLSSAYNLFNTMLSNPHTDDEIENYENYIYSKKQPLHDISSFFSILFYNFNGFYQYFNNEFENHIKDFIFRKKVKEKLEQIDNYNTLSEDVQIIIRDFAFDYIKYFDVLLMYLSKENINNPEGVKDVINTIISNKDSLNTDKSLEENVTLIKKELEKTEIKSNYIYLDESNCKKPLEWIYCLSDIENKWIILKPSSLNRKDRTPLNQICISTSQQEIYPSQMYMKNQMGINLYDSDDFIGELDENTLNEELKNEVISIKEKIINMNEKNYFTKIESTKIDFNKYTAYVIAELEPYLTDDEENYIYNQCLSLSYKYDIIDVDKNEFANCNNDYLKTAFFYFELRKYKRYFKSLSFIDEYENISDVIIADKIYNEFIKSNCETSPIEELFDDIPF